MQPKDEHRPVLDGQTFEAALQLLAQGELARGILNGGLQAKNPDVRVVAAFGSEFIVDRVDEQPIQPGVEAIGVAKGRQVAPAADQGLMICTNTRSSRRRRCPRTETR